MRNPVDPVSPLPTALDDMVARPWAYDFFQALRILEARHPELPRLGCAGRPQDEPVRLGQAPQLAFATAALHSVSPADGAGRTRMQVLFFGMFGANGPLPLNLTEYARERMEHHDDPTLLRFADIFHHRLLLLFYRAWSQGQPTTSLDRPRDDRFGNFIASLIGLGSEVRRNASTTAHPGRFDPALHHAGLLSTPVRNAAGLAALLSSHLRRPVRVEQFAGEWLPLERSERTRITRGGPHGRVGAVIGRNAVLGASVWDRQHSFRLHIGPLDRPAFDSLLPGGKDLSDLRALVEQYVGIEFGWSVRLQLKKTDVEACRLGRAGRLGWTSWLRSAARAEDPVLALRVTAGLMSN